MSRATTSRLFGIFLLATVASAPVAAISPSWVMFYGGSLQEPVVAPMFPSNGTTFLWNTYPMAEGGVRIVNGRIERAPLPADLDGRPFITFAIFWGRWNEKPTRPEDASQHGRIYLPTATAPAAMVLTWSWMEDENAATTGHPQARPIPADLNEHRDTPGIDAGFVSGRALTAGEVELVKRLGVPGL